MRVGVLGATTSRGRRVVRDLLERPEVTHLLLIGPGTEGMASQHPERLTAISAPLNTFSLTQALGGLQVAVACLEDTRGPAKGLAGGNGDPLGAERVALRAARAAGVPYVTACEEPATVRALMLPDPGPDPHASPDPHPDLPGGPGEPSPAVVGMSWSPGLSNLLAVAGAQILQRVTSVRVSWFVSGSDGGAFRLDPVLAAGADDAEVIEHGMRRPATPHRRWPGVPRSLPGITPGRQVYFPEPVGWQRVHVVAGAELLTLPGTLTGLDAMSVAGGTDGSGARLSRRLPRILAPRGPHGDGWSAMRVDVTGRSGGIERTVSLGVVDHLDNLESAPVVVACLLAGDGHAGTPHAGTPHAGTPHAGTPHAGPARHRQTPPGPVGPEAGFDPAPFLRLLAERGVRVAHLER